jgi:hypothetical protein
MKNSLRLILISCLAFFLSFSTIWAQSSCTVASSATAYHVKMSDFPYASSAGVTVSQGSTAGVFSYGSTYGTTCSGVGYTTTPGGMLLGSSGVDTITFTFSGKVTNFSFVLSGSNDGEVITVMASSGTIALSNYCSARFSTPTANTLPCNAGVITGTMVTVDNPAGATTYRIAHNGIGGGTILQLLDCIQTYKGPANIVDGIQLWLDGSDVNNNPGTNPADATRLPVWKDISGNGNDAMVLAGQDTARMNTAQINGKDVMQFTGVSGAYGSVYEVPKVDIRATSMPKSTIFTVYRPAAPTGAIQGIWGNDNGDWDRFFMPSFGAADGVVSVGPPTNNVAVPTAGEAGTTKLLTAVYHSGVTDSSIVYFNAIPVSRVTDNTHLTDAQTTLRIGWDGDNNPFTGDIAEMVVYNRKLTDCEIKAVNRYFGYKYGVSFTSATVTPSTQQYICSGDTVSLKGAGGSTFQWLKDGTLIAAATDSIYKATTAGNYAVIASASGCSDTSVATTVTVVPATIYVDSSKALSGNGASWATAKKTLSEALTMANAVSCPVQIWVRKGTYYPTSGTSRDSSFRIYRNNIKVYGGFDGTESTLTARSIVANPTILSGDIGVNGDSTDNSYHVVTIVGTPSKQIDTNTIVDGFRITRGNANGGGMFSGNSISFFQTDGGGMICVGMTAGNKCSPLIENCTFHNNAATFGAGLYHAAHGNGASNPVLRSCTFEYNSSSNQGGGFHSWGDGASPSLVATFTNCTFRYNKSVSHGGAGSVRASSAAPSMATVFTKCTFTGNTATGNNGGAINFEGANNAGPAFDSCTFDANLSNFGGAVHVGNVTSSFFTNCVVRNNRSTYAGGGIIIANGISSFTGSSFSGNFADGFGGAICNPFSGTRTMNVKHCTFTGNSTNSNGAAFYLQDGITATIDSCAFSGNRAAFGAGLCLYTAAPSFHISNSVFSNDTASYGSIVRNVSAVASSFSNCRFESNYALTQGGVENIGNGNMTLNRCVFFNNRSANNAAGFLSSGASSTGTLDNCIFSGNTTTGTGGGGGALQVQQGSVVLNNTTLSGNSTSSTAQPNSGGIWVESGGTIALNNSIVWGAAAQQVSNAGTATYNYSLVKGLALAAPSLSINPQFVNASDPDGADNIWGTTDDGLRLTPCSPCLNTGSNGLVPAGMTNDYALAARIQNVTVDMGSYEHAFAAQGLPDVTISASVNPSCSGETVSFSHIEVWPGSSTTYTWYRNSTPVASTAAFSSSTLTYNDTIWLVMTNNDCALSDTSNRIVMLVNLGRIYVDGTVATSGTGLSWLSPFKTVSEALTLANSTPATCATEIWVRKGTYYPTANTNRDSSFRITRNNIKLYGGFAGGETLLSARSVTANPTILSGDIGTANDSADNSYHVMTIQAKATSQIDTNTAVDGFIITGGNAQSGGSFTYNGIIYNRQDGGGMHIWGANSGNKCTPVIANCTLTRNTATFGGGIYNAGFNSGGACSPVFRNNTFSYNKANTSGGGLFNNGQNGGLSSPAFDSCTFSFNTANNGGGMYNQASGGGTSAGTISNCTFNNNKATADGGGFFNSFGQPLVRNCRFYLNDAGFSGGACFQQGGKSTFNLNIFEQNTGQIAGAIRTNTGDPSITLFRNVFYRNTSSINDAGALSLVCGTGYDTVINNLFVQNKAFGAGPNGGGAMVQEGGTSSYIISNTFYADSSAGSGGSVHFKAGGTNRLMYNNIFYKSYNGSSASDYNLASGTTVTESNNLFSNTNPRFVRESNPVGADGIWLTGDDGLDLLPCSPAVNTGTTAPPADIRNRARVGLPDIGAYEEQGKPLPAAPVATSPVSYCQNATSVALSATKTSASDTLKWYNAVPALLPGAPIPSTATTGTFTWYVSQADSTGCESAKTTITVTIKPTPVAPVATTPIVYCQGITATALTATLAAGSDTLKWYDAAMTPLAAAPTPSTGIPGTYTYYVSQKTSLNCEGPKTTITVQVNPTPALPTTITPVTYCQNAPSVALTATAASASDTLRWYNSVPTLLSGAPTPSTATAGTFTFYVSQKNNFSCEGAKKAITVQINPTPIAPPSASPVTYCQDDVASALTATKASSTDTLRWYDASLTLLAGAPVPQTVTPGTTTYHVSAKTAIGCEGPKTTISVIVNPRPIAPAVVTPINVCVGVDPAPLSATGTNLKWYTAASGGTSMATLKPNVSVAGTNTYYVSQTNAFSCESPRAALTVNVRPSPVVTVAPVDMPTFVFCVGDSVTIKAASATAISYEWKINTATIPGSVSDTLHIDTTATYTVIVKDSYGCADTESVFVMKNPLPKPKLSPVDVTICKGVNIILYGTPGTTGYKYEWFKDGNPMGIDTTKDRITVDTTGYYMVRMTDIYTCTVNSNGSSISQYPEMVKPTIVRTGSVLKLSATYASYQWYRNGKIITGATSKTYTLSFDGDYHVVVLDANGCEGTSEVLQVHALGINPAEAQGGIRVYPNPTQGKVIIDAGAKINVIVTDITGRELLRGQQTTEVNLEPFADGIYMLRIFDQEGRLLHNQRINKQTK